MMRWLAVYLIAATPLLAEAHAYLVSSDPPHKASLSEAPTRLKLHFSEPIEIAFMKLVLQRDGQIQKAPLKISPGSDKRTVIIESAFTDAGSYQLGWSIVARDGHRTEGSVIFSVNAR